MSFPFYKQHDSMDCGPACLRMIAKYYGKSYSLNFLREKCYIDKEGVSLRGIEEAAELCGFRTVAVKIPFYSENGQTSLTKAPLPAILHWNDNHFVVLYKISKKKVWIADPAHGRINLSHPKFLKHGLKKEKTMTKELAYYWNQRPHLKNQELKAKIR